MTDAVPDEIAALLLPGEQVRLFAACRADDMGAPLAEIGFRVGAGLLCALIAAAAFALVRTLIVTDGLDGLSIAAILIALLPLIILGVLALLATRATAGPVGDVSDFAVTDRRVLLRYGWQAHLSVPAGSLAGIRRYDVKGGTNLVLEIPSDDHPCPCIAVAENPDQVESLLVQTLCPPQPEASHEQAHKPV